MKQNLYDTEFELYSVAGSTGIDANGDQTTTKTLVGTYPCQIDNTNGKDAVTYGKRNEVSTHLIFSDIISDIDVSYEIVCQGMVLDILFLSKNEGGLTSFTRGVEIYCIFRAWVD